MQKFIERLLGQATPSVAKLILLTWVTLALIGVVILLLPDTQPNRLLAERSDWTVNGFFLNGEPSPNDLPSEILNKPGIAFWRSWSPETGHSAGSIYTRPFTPNTKVIGIPLVGYPNGPDNNIYIKNVKTLQIKHIRFGNLHEQWQEYHFKIPADWTGCPLILGATTEGHSKYIGIGTPYEIGDIRWLRISLPTIAAIQLGMLILLIIVSRPALALLDLIKSRIPAETRLVHFPVAAAGTGFALFFLFYFLPSIAKPITWVIITLGILLTVKDLKYISKQRKRYRECLARPTILWMLICLAATTLLFAQKSTSLAWAANYRFSPASWSTDNQIPLKLSELLEDHRPLSEMSLGLWHVSDRPPAMGGLLIVSQLAFRAISPNATHLLRPVFNIAFSAALLSLWVLPTWVLLKRCNLKTNGRVWGILLLSLTPFFFFNTIYTWPKLISGTLGISALVFFIDFALRKDFLRTGILAGLAMGLSVMCHGSAAFGVLAICLVFFLIDPKRHFRLLTTSTLIFLLTISPWIIWTKVYDPPGNALTKYAFAGTFGFNERDKPVFDTIRDSYASEPTSAHVKRRLQGIKTWIGTYSPVHSPVGWAQEGNSVRLYQFYHIIPAIGFLWFALLIWHPSKYSSGSHRTKAASRKRVIFAVAMTGLLTQLLLMWDSHNLHHYAYSTIIFIEIYLILRLAPEHNIVRSIITSITALLFLAFWAVAPALEFGDVNIGIFSASLISIFSGTLLCISLSMVKSNHSK